MKPEQIRKMVRDFIEGKEVAFGDPNVRFEVKDHDMALIFLAEIAAQLAELNGGKLERK